MACCDFASFKTWYDNQPKVCAYCGIEQEFLEQYCIKRKGAATLHIDRINNRRGYVLGNMRLACFVCNSTMKWTRSEEFIKVVVGAILANGMLDQYHLWNVPMNLREEACFWHQFRRGEHVDFGDCERYRCEIPNAEHYLPDGHYAKRGTKEYANIDLPDPNRLGEEAS